MLYKIKIKNIFLALIIILTASSFNAFGMKPTIKIEDKYINALISELKKEISQNFDLKIINLCPGSIEIIVSGYEKDPENKNFTQNYPNILFNRSLFSEKSEKDLNNFLEENNFIKELTNNVSNEKIIFTGFGALSGEKEYFILDKMLRNNKKNCTIQDIHLIDICYNYIITKFGNQDFDNRLLKFLITKNYLLNKYNYFLLNQKAKQIKLFLHISAECYLECISKYKLDKTNLITAFSVLYLVDPIDFTKLISKEGVSDKCLFISNSPEFLKILYAKNRYCDVEDITMQINCFKNMTKTAKTLRLLEKEIELNKSSLAPLEIKEQLEVLQKSPIAKDDERHYFSIYKEGLKKRNLPEKSIFQRITSYFF